MDGEAKNRLELNIQLAMSAVDMAVQYYHCQICYVCQAM